MRRRVTLSLTNEIAGLIPIKPLDDQRIDIVIDIKIYNRQISQQQQHGYLGEPFPSGAPEIIPKQESGRAILWLQIEPLTYC